MKKLKMIFLVSGFLFDCRSYAQKDNVINLLQNPGFEIADQSGKLPAGWKLVFPRQEIAPVYTCESGISHSGNKAARLSSAGNRGTYGFLTTTLQGIRSTKKDIKQLNTLSDSVFLSNESYLVSGYFRTPGIEFPDRNIRIKISWLDEKGTDILTEFVSLIKKEGDWYHLAELKRAPVNASSLTINLILQWVESGSVIWDDISVERAPSQGSVAIKAASASLWPKSPSTTQKNLMFYSDLISKAGKMGADILCLGEGITVVSTGKRYADVAEPIPGPSTKMLGEAARKAHTWVVAGLYEREGSLIYNTAVLINREGNVAGKYRKTHLPQTEVEGGLTPGDDYPVFKTDFGTIGIEICYDNFFPEVARNLMLNGAQVIFCPIWGDIRGLNTEWNVASRARAIDNSVFFVSSMYEPRGSIIIDPNGRILAEPGRPDGLVIAELRLDMRTFERWLSVRNYGEWKNLFLQERRTDTY